MRASRATITPVTPTPGRVFAWSLRAALALPLVVWALQLAGRHYSVDVAMVEHAVLEQVLVWGWMLDEAVGARAIAAAVVGAALAAVLAALLGAFGADAPFVRRTQPVAALVLAVPLGALAVFGYALAPGTMAGLLIAFGLCARGEPSPVLYRRTLRGLVPGAALALLFAADLLATSREGTWYDRLTDLPGGASAALAGVSVVVATGLLRRTWRRPEVGLVGLVALAHGALAGPLAGLAWGGIAGVAVGLAQRLRAGGLPAIPDPASSRTWATGLALPTLAACACLLGNGAVEVQRCPDAHHPAVSLVHDAPAPFDLAWNGARLGVVHREQGWLRLFDADGVQTHEIGPVEGDLEEIFALPGDRGFLLTEILDDAPFTLLRIVDPSTGTTVDHRLAGMCWVSSMAWDAAHDAVLLGCETQADLLRLYADGRLEPVGRLPADDDLEDLHLRTDARTAYAVSLAEGDQLWALSPDDASVQAQRPLGGLNYAVVHDPGSDRVLVSRFLDAQVVAFDAGLEEVGRVHAGFGVRPLVGLPAHGLVLSAAMFDGRLRAIDPDGPRVRASLRLGGRVKALDVDPEESRAWIGSTCGVFEVDLRRWLD